jgi:hypothetical protein
VSFRAWCIAIAFLTFQGSAGQAASGTALGVDPAARLKSQSETRTLVVGTDIFIGDTVITDARGLVQIKFFDGTELVVGPRSALVIQDYLLREDNSPGKMVLDALGGTFRFVTGNGPKDRYQIRTPGAVLAVRGTAFDVNVDLSFDPPRVNVLGYEGLVTMCDGANNCAEIGTACEIGQADGDGARVIGIGRNAEGMGGSYFRKAFRLSVSESGLLPEFRIPGSRDCSQRHQQAAESSNDADEGSGVVPPGPGPGPDPEPEPEPEPEPGGDCAGNSNPNPGNSQNCNK